MTTMKGTGLEWPNLPIHCCSDSRLLLNHEETFPKLHAPVAGIIVTTVISQGETAMNILLEVSQTFIALA